MLKSLFKSQKTRFDPVIMYNRKKEKIKSLIASFVIVSTFIIASYYTNIYFEEIEQLIGDSVGGMLVYVIINIIDVILAPVSLIAVIGVASNIWGWIISALLTIIGWTLGGYIAFKITRKFGVPLIDKFIKLEKLHEIEKKVDSNHLFWSIVILRIIIPADLLSYALGLFSGISTKKYILATIIGVTPLGVTLAYLGSMPFEFQIIGFITVGVIIVTGIIVRSKFNKHKETNMNLIKWFEERVKKLKWYDLELLKASTLFATLFALTASASLRDWLLAVEWYWYFALAVIFSAPLIKRFFSK